jgi:hypothetical protein
MTQPASDLSFALKKQPQTACPKTAKKETTTSKEIVKIAVCDRF